MFRKIDHIGIVTRDLEALKTLYRDVLEMEPAHEEVNEELGIKAALYPIGEVALEYIEPISDKAPLKNFLETRGEGIHHICFLVDDIEGTLKKLLDRGMRLIDKKPRMGANNKRIAFLHPKSMHGVLVELAQEA
ncbi:MAG: methylmalonyl-CoA epimerase [Candidatus Eisenbacteria sp.]|nr:methylmalonyl-CoA epimerase [Candidatus Eisenbacteria bacterium]